MLDEVMTNDTMKATYEEFWTLLMDWNEWLASTETIFWEETAFVNFGRQVELGYFT
jgi:hypothetical protein